MTTWSDSFGLDPFGFGVDAPPPAGDSTLPTVTDVTPTPGTPVARNAFISLTVSDEVALRRVVLIAKFSTSWEVIYDGSGFAPGYAPRSTRTELVPGASYRFRVRREAGWPEAPVILPIPTDTSGNESA